MTVIAPAPKPRRTAKPKPPPLPRHTLLRKVLADIEEFDHHAHRPALYERLEAEGMTSTYDDASGFTLLKLLGITAGSSAGRPGALTVWARLARQELLALPEDPAA